MKILWFRIGGPEFDVCGLLGLGTTGVVNIMAVVFNGVARNIKSVGLPSFFLEVSPFLRSIESWVHLWMKGAGTVK